MRDFTCPNCGQHLAFENSVCLACGSAVGFSPEEMVFLVISPSGGDAHGGSVAAGDYQLCANLHLAECNWLVEVRPVRQLCASCTLTRTRPLDTDLTGLAAFAEAERAKRRLIAELLELRLPVVGRQEDPAHGLAFDLLSSVAEPVTTGHDSGVITVDLAEGDDIHREQLRVELDEPYRTLLGHFRHEIGHYYFYRLVAGSPERLEAFRRLFGDPDADYQTAMESHYRRGAPAGWPDDFVSSYASMHAAEDWAETFAHYLHIRSTL
nr:putative zinc-binding metallopeptidase [Mycobacterium sp.]